MTHARSTRFLHRRHSACSTALPIPVASPTTMVQHLRSHGYIMFVAAIASLFFAFVNCAFPVVALDMLQAQPIWASGSGIGI